MRNILIIAPFPTHPVIAGNRTIILTFSNLLKEMGYTIHYFWISEDYHYNKTELDSCHEYWGKNFYFHPKNILNCLKDRVHNIIFFKRTGNYNLETKCPIGIKRYLSEILKKNQFAAIIINYVFFSRLFKYFKNEKKILFTHDVFTNKYGRTGFKWFSLNPLDESRGLNRADIILSVQEEETIFFKYLTNKKIFTIYCCLPINPTPLVGVQGSEFKLLFLSGNNLHNVESIKKFYYDVFPELRQSFPQIKLIIGGAICKELEYLEDNNIELQGNISDLYQFYRQADICINPTFNGTGLKIKTFEALSFGKILVAHPHSVIGVFEKEKVPIFLAENKSEYINHFIHLFNNVSEWNKYKTKSIEYMTNLHSYVKRQFYEIFN
jgi:hypothetical protein